MGRRMHPRTPERAAWLRAARAELYMLQEDLGAQAGGVSGKLWHLYESGKVGVKDELLDQVAEVLRKRRERDGVPGVVPLAYPH